MNNPYHTIVVNAAECMSDISISTYKLFYQLSRNGMYLVSTTICNNMYTAGRQFTSLTTT